MRKRTKYIVHCPGDNVARFSDELHAFIFAKALSKRFPNHLIEVTTVGKGLVGLLFELFYRGTP